MRRIIEEKRAYEKEYYKNNIVKLRKQKNAEMRRRRRNRRRLIVDYLVNHPCIDCGEDDFVVLEFDHIRGKKKHSISDMVSGGYSEEAILDEMNKCVVRCANCHRRKTAKQLKWYKGIKF